MSPRIQAISLLVLLASLATVVQHPLHIMPLGAVAVFAGAAFRDLRWAFAVPLLARLARDLAVEAGGRTGPAFTVQLVILLASTYVCLALTVWLATSIRNRWNRGWQGVQDIAAVGLAGWAIFFLVTNFVFWITYDMYPRTLAGLGTCYAAAVPMELRKLLGDTAYLGILFGSFSLLERFVPGVAMEPTEPVAAAARTTA